MSADLLATPSQKQPDGYPFHIGTRYIHTIDANGSTESTAVPLTEEDFLHPQLDDRFMLMDAHSKAVFTLRNAITTAARNRPRMRVFSEHLIDWQVGKIKAHGLDVVVFDNFDVEWDSYEGTLPVGDVGADVVVVFEVTSASTRHVDFGKKFDEFEVVGIPFYLVVDTAAAKDDRRIMGFELVDNNFREMQVEAKLGLQVPGLDLWFRWENDRVYVADADGLDIPDPAELAEQLAKERELATTTEKARKTEKRRADKEKRRADVADAAREKEKERADNEKRRADEAERRLKELLADKPNGHSSSNGKPKSE